MAAAFDPYLQWLGIRDPQRPPNHYRLLGLELFENDAGVIAMSADRQMAHLRNFKTGPDAEVAERLLNELSAARICLLKPERKASYDSQLRAALRPVPAVKAASINPPVLANANSSFPTVAPVVRTNTSAVMKSPAAKASWKPWAILASMLVLCGGLVALLIYKNSPSGDELIAAVDNGEHTQTVLAKAPQKTAVPNKAVAQTNVSTKSPDKTQQKSPDTTNSRIETPTKNKPSVPDIEPVTKPVPEKASSSNNKKNSKQQPNSTNAPPAVDLTTLLGEEVESKAPGTPENSTVEPKTSTENLVIAQAPASEPAKPTRLAVPDKAIITSKEKEIREIFAEEYKSQKPEVKNALAGKLRQSSTESKDDSSMRYVLLNEARTNAILGGSVKLAVEITDELLRDYDLSESDERFSLFSKLLTSGNRTPAYGQLVLEELRGAIVRLQESDDYEVALKLVNMAQAAARNMRDPALVTELTQRAKEINLQKTAYQRAKLAKENLAKNPDDPAANELWGAYLSFTKGDFTAGLPFLARGASADLADLAARELQNKQTPADQLALADDWWTYGEKLQTQDAARSTNIRQYAGQKYVALFPKLTGIDKAKAEKRIDELKKISDQKSKRQLDQMIAQLIATRWQVDMVNGGPPEFMVFRPDGTMTNRVFSTWAIENNELVLKGLMIGKIKFNYVGFDVDYFHLNGKLDYQGKAKPVAP